MPGNLLMVDKGTFHASAILCDDRNQLREQIVTSVLRGEREIKIKFPHFHLVAASTLNVGGGGNYFLIVARV